MLAVVNQLKHSTQLRWNRVHKFKTKVNMSLEFGSYVVKTADTKEELLESFKLRHEVFKKEFCGVAKDGLDIDRYDYHFDHLIILQKQTRKLIGTYRLNCSAFSDESYTGLEFDVSSILKESGPHLELGRACIHKDYRKGSVISLLWRGIAEYMNLSGARLLFGCSSLKVNNARDAALVFRYLVEQSLVKTYPDCSPTNAFQMPDFDSWYGLFERGLTEKQTNEAEGLIPSLLKSYLKLGATIACTPAFDREFDCIDLLTVLKKDDLSSSRAERFHVVR